MNRFFEAGKILSDWAYRFAINVTGRRRHPIEVHAAYLARHVLLKAAKHVGSAAEVYAALEAHDDGLLRSLRDVYADHSECHPHGLEWEFIRELATNAQSLFCAAMLNAWIQRECNGDGASALRYEFSDTQRENVLRKIGVPEALHHLAVRALRVAVGSDNDGAPSASFDPDRFLDDLELPLSQLERDLAESMLPDINYKSREFKRTLYRAVCEELPWFIVFPTAVPCDETTFTNFYRSKQL